MIYIIDDDQNVRDGFMILLKSAGYNCSCFESAEDFLRDFHLEANDLLLLDIHLPGMNGNSLLQLLVKKGLDLPVIIVTAYDDQATRIAAKDYGAMAYFRKPVDSEALIDAIRFNIQQNANNTTLTNIY